jgi:hypothetical protein
MSQTGIKPDGTDVDSIRDSFEPDSNANNETNVNAKQSIESSSTKAGIQIDPRGRQTRKALGSIRVNKELDSNAIWLTKFLRSIILR